MKNNSIKEYYIKIEKMMENAVTLLTAINESLTTSSAEVSINMMSSQNENITVRIPSFIYLENKLEEISTNFNNLFNIPKTGEAWFDKSGDMIKLSLIKSNNAPITPTISNLDNLTFNIKDNNIFKDLVTPRTFIRLNLSNITDNISQMYVKKIVLNDSVDANYLSNYHTYTDIKNGLFNKSLGSDYEEYDSVLDMPIREDEFNSQFVIEDVPIDYEENPYLVNGVLTYKVRLNTITYYDKNDSSIEYQLKNGDLITLIDEYTIYKVKNISTIYNSDNNNDQNDHIVEIEEYIGHTVLQSYYENQNMIFTMYNSNYSKYHYIDIPLEENRNIILFLGTIYNNIKSTLSEAIHIDLSTIYMKDDNGNYILDDNGSKINYIDYYKKYCKNIGDMMLGFTELSYPQTSNFTTEELRRMTDSEEMKNIVSNTLYIDDDLVLNVSRINDHLIDDEMSKNIISLHEQKNEINSQLRTIQDNVDQIYSQLTSTDFSQESLVSQDSLRSNLKDYYDQRLELEKQLLSVIDNINQEKENVIGLAESKYRVRGITNSSDKYDSSIESPIVSYLHSTFGNNVELIGLDVEYKYKSINRNTTSLISKSNVLFTDWNKMKTIERERFLKFDSSTNSYSIVFSNYNATSNIIKWNQIDIPITQGEDVVIRIRYKLNIGQPFINLYTPWSNEITVSFPVEYTETTEISSIVETNDDDVVNSRFLRTLINDGYQEHINNKIIDNAQTYYHMPENIYSGFNTSENKFISLKDKLFEMNNDMTIYKAAIDNEINAKYEVLLEWDNNSLQLSNMTNNNIVINELANGTTDAFIKKKMNLIIRNVGSTPIKLYSILPGNIDTPLIYSDNQYLNEYIKDYERVPILIEGSSIPSESIIPQYLGQWAYFRETNPFTRESLYYDDYVQRQNDISSVLQKSRATFVGQLSKYLNVDNKQALLPFRKRYDINTQSSTNTWGFLSINETSTSYQIGYDESDNAYDYNKIDKYFLYSNVDNSNNSYILKYEHLINTNLNNENDNRYLSNNVSLSDFIQGLNKSNVYDYNGAFFIPELISRTQLLCDTSETNQYKVLDIGKSLSIPLLYEYFLTGSNDTSNVQISKTLAFDLRPSLLKETDHYIITVTAKYDYSQITATIQNNVSLQESIADD